MLKVICHGINVLVIQNQIKLHLEHYTSGRRRKIEHKKDNINESHIISRDFVYSYTNSIVYKFVAKNCACYVKEAPARCVVTAHSPLDLSGH